MTESRIPRPGERHYDDPDFGEPEGEESSFERISREQREERSVDATGAARMKLKKDKQFSVMEQHWRHQLVIDLAKDLFRSFYRWDVEIHNLSWPEWKDLSEEMRQWFIDAAVSIVDKREEAGDMLKKL